MPRRNTNAAPRVKERPEPQRGGSAPEPRNAPQGRTTRVKKKGAGRR